MGSWRGPKPADLNYVSLFGDSFTEQAVALTTTISQLLGQPALDGPTAQAAVAEASDQDRPTMLRRLTKDLILNPARRIELDDVITQESGKIVAALPDNGRFPTDRAGAGGDEWVVQLVERAQDYSTLTQPLCWSLQVAARWADPDTLRTWVNATRAIVAEAVKQQGGYQEAADLRYIPGLCLTVTAALATTGQARWDNLRAQVVVNAVPTPYQGRDRILRVVSPHAPFPAARPGFRTPSLELRSMKKIPRPRLPSSRGSRSATTAPPRRSGCIMPCARRSKAVPRRRRI